MIMKTHVDFEFSKNWGSITKGTKKSLRIAQARSLQDVRKVGKILGPTKSKEDVEVLAESKKLIEQEVKDQIGGLRKENTELKKALRIANNKLDKQATSRATK